MLDRQTDRSVEGRLKEHTKHLQFGQPKKSHIAKHNIDKEHSMKFNCTFGLDKVADYVDLKVKEAAEIQLNLYNFQQGLGLHGKLNLAASASTDLGFPNDKLGQAERSLDSVHKHH
jgi:hypothetical protein